MLVGRAFEYCFIAYGLLIGIALIVAAMIRFIYFVVHKTSSRDGKKA